LRHNAPAVICIFLFFCDAVVYGVTSFKTSWITNSFEAIFIDMSCHVAIGTSLVRFSFYIATLDPAEPDLKVFSLLFPFVFPELLLKLELFARI
jgi:hypothetical protein